MKSFFQYLRYCLGCILALAFGACIMQAQMIPDKPIRNFKLSMFDEEKGGYIIWALKGAEGRYINRDEIHIIGMDMQLYSGDEDCRKTSRILSSKAEVFPKRGIARGRKDLRMEGEEFVLTGENWVWNSKKNWLHVKEKAEVVFQQDLNNLIK